MHIGFSDFLSPGKLILHPATFNSIVCVFFFFFTQAFQGCHISKSAITDPLLIVASQYSSLGNHFLPATTDTMADVQASSADSAPTPSTSHRGSHRRGRAGRGRGRGSHNRGSDHGRGGHMPPPSGVATPPPPPTTTTEAGVASVPAEQRHRPHSGTRGSSSRGTRDRRGGQRGGRGGRATQDTQIAPRRTFGGRLTSTAAQDAPSLSGDAPEFVPGQEVPQQQQQVSKKSGKAKETSQPRPKRASKSEAPDLTTRIHEDIDNSQYECVICSSEVLRTSRVWACTLCWTVTHHHCTKKWYNSQMKDGKQPQGSEPTWRCPGCNSTLTEDTGSYHCWCGKEINPRSTPGLPPHSCGQTCSKPRGTCPHPCGLQCHAGPCPPCTLMGPIQSCYCGKHTSQKRCIDTDYTNGFSCNEVCADLLPCGEHACPQKCHPGLCGACEVLVFSTCYCGREHKEIPCEQRDDILESYNYGQLQAKSDDPNILPGSWFEGSFTCKVPCARKFDCGVHECKKECHPVDEEAAHCPLSPDVVTHCPCGKTPLGDIMNEPRISCSDEIAHCTKKCGKILPCGHQCQDICHTGACQPCFQKVDITCRCSRTTVQSTCHGVPPSEVMKPECKRVCRALLNCGRHQCYSHCCAGEKRAAKRQANKRRLAGTEDVEDEHICTRTCGRLLKCGKHFCQQLCHKGACPSCLEAVFDEITCSCGRTTLYPPQPCGSRIPQCRFPCTRARACGHPQVEHQCHPDDVECPKCPFLVEKTCICGKEVLRNQPCWFAEARCGRPCGKRLKCGTHFCKLLCHQGECEDAAVPGSHCSQPCGKQREFCGHEDLDQCHVPFSCKEEKPCQSETFITCECQRRKQKVKCLSTRLDPRGPSREPLKCDDECLRQKRNRQLAEALNIDPDHTDDHIPYQDVTLKLFRDNTEWAQTQEREFRVFAESNARNMRFRPMKPHQRQFLHVLAEDYGMDSESQDPEPHRHVSIFKGPRFVSAPRKTLMQCLRLKTNVSASRAAGPSTAANKTSPLPYNAILLSRPRFGLTAQELDPVLSADLSAVTSSTNNLLTFTTEFLPSDEVLIKTITKTTIASIASGTVTPLQVEALLTTLKPKIAKAVATNGFAAGVTLCAAEPTSNIIVRREGIDGGSGGSGGWSTVASRAAARPKTWAPAPAVATKPTGFLALRKLGAKKPEQKLEQKLEQKPEEKEEEAMEEEEEREGGETTDVQEGPSKVGNDHADDSQ